MIMDLKDNKRIYTYSETFKFALEGIRVSILKEKNIRFHLLFSVIVIVLAIIFNLTQTEWLFILIAIAGMIVVEMINTAIERVVDLVTDQYHPLAGQAKDIAAGAVLIYAIFSVIIGMIIFIPKILMFL
ncbi:diacylglycerol kinase family protein [Pseudoneobacillus rhizosphaerae]|uniref:Undecaprenol kinase n=1 Tax=Pseudoneobacillus rhizosphaerae TaxID=2880968 RepID=A0A9C7G9U2_9BACI|nr:diacylglycerol kinase family protein [Pseudoneobacillus rhizosphaerae]CAG9608120.1 Undecaprenol kinase [Pseudoneobacillus rhizosphaerae]